jgi:hypothetical protein
MSLRVSKHPAEGGFDATRFLRIDDEYRLWSKKNY